MRQGPILHFARLGVAAMLLVSASVAAQIKTIDKDIKVVVKEGDNLSSITKQVMGTSSFWQEVAKQNKIVSPQNLKPGQVITFAGSFVQDRNFAKVVFAKGETSIIRHGSKDEDAVEKGLRIFLGDILTTGEDGFVSLTFEGESLINVQPDSRIQIIEFDCFDKEKSCVVNLLAEEGQMNFDVRNVGFKKPPRYSIETPYASAAVRGTKVDVDVSKQIILGVTQGTVEVTSDGLSATLPLGKGTVSGEGRYISTVYDLLKKPEYNPFIRLSAEDRISWAPVDKARSYRYVMAENESLSDVIVRGSTTSTFINVVPDADQFFIGTRAIDVNGLKGFPGVKRVNRVEIDKGVEAPDLQIELSDNELKIVNGGKLNAEVHVGSELQEIDGLGELVSFDAYELGAGKTLELSVDGKNDIYISTRAVISDSSVSAYGSIYEFKGSAK